MSGGGRLLHWRLLSGPVDNASVVGGGAFNRPFEVSSAGRCPSVAAASFTQTTGGLASFAASRSPRAGFATVIMGKIESQPPPDQAVTRGGAARRRNVM